MRFFNLASVAVLSVTLATTGFATPGQDIVTSSLQAQGFEVRLVHWTFLGRIRIIAVSADIRREIVINPTTGEILRDYSQRIVEAPVPRQDHDNGSDPSAPRSTETEGAADVDATAVMALESIGMDVAPPILTDQVQN
jgi:hypothetical protein